MAEITAALVKELRESTGAGMMDCKKALAETGGDLQAAIDWLRAKGLSAAAKKAGRVAAEGLIGVAVEGPKGAMVEVNAETDFVGRNESFQEFVRTVTRVALQRGGDIEALKAAPYPGGKGSVADRLTELVATIGENMALRRVERVAVSQGVVSAYVHSAAAPGIGRIGVLVGIESRAEPAKVAELGKQIAMHVAAANPLAVDRNGVSPEVVARERAVLLEQAKESGKPEAIAIKMVEGRLRRFFEESCLVDQAFVIDPERKVGDAVAEVAKATGQPVAVKGFVRFALGEGIERKESDFAAEVAATLRG